MAEHTLLTESMGGWDRLVGDVQNLVVLDTGSCWNRERMELVFSFITPR